MFLLNRILTLNFKSMFEKIDLISKKIGKSKLYVFYDILKCALLYQAGYMDYYIFEMYNVAPKYRKTYITRGKNNKFIKQLNNKDYWHYFKNKDEFNEKFKEFVKRDSISLSSASKEEVINWMEKTEGPLIAKPRSGACGKGILKINKSKFDSLDKLYEHLKENEIGILENMIIQHDDMNKLNSSCVNTIRTITVNKDGNVNIICAYLRIGNGAIVDNFNSGGMMSPVDIQTGKVKYVAVDKAGNIYENHPITGTEIVGFEIPMWEEAKEMVKQAAKIIPEVGIVGWDVCITDNGPALVEGNQFPGHDIYQLPCHMIDNIGMLPVFERAIYGKNK